MKLYEGPGLIADKSNAMYLPIRIQGAQYTPFSRLKGKVRLRWFPKITLTVLPPQRFEIDASIKGRKRRAALALKLYDIMSEMLFDSSNLTQTLFDALIDQHHIHGSRHVILEDIARKPICYRKFISKSVVLGAAVKPVKSQTLIGLLLPWYLSHGPFSASKPMAEYLPCSIFLGQALVSACKTAAIKTVYTSKFEVETEDSCTA